MIYLIILLVVGIKKLNAMPRKTQCTFGQGFENAEAYNFQRAEVIFGNKSNVANYVEYNSFKVSSLTLNDSYDFENFCKLFDINETTLINTFANNKTKIENLCKFIFNNVHGPCFCISVFDKSYKTDISSEKSLTNDETKILEFHFGRHFFILVPVEKAQKPHNKEIEDILNDSNAKSPKFLEATGTVLINYEEKHTSTKISKFLSSLFKVVKTKESICLSMKIANFEEKNLDVKQELLVILALKNLLHLIQSKFPSEAEYQQDDKKTVLMDELLDLSQQICNQLHDLKECLNLRNPPRNLKTVYWDLTFFHHHYLKLILQNSPKIPINYEIAEVLKEVCEALKTTFYTKFEEFWMIQIDDKNAEIINEYIKDKNCIIFNESTKKYLKQMYNENNEYIWIVSTRQKSKKHKEPMLLYTLNKNLYPIGIVDNVVTDGETTAKSLYISPCICKASKLDKKVWMCFGCKKLLFETFENEKWLKCECGYHMIDELDKRCGQCSNKSKNACTPPIISPRTNPIISPKKSSISSISLNSKTSSEKSSTCTKEKDVSKATSAKNPPKSKPVLPPKKSNISLNSQTSTQQCVIGTPENEKDNAISPVNLPHVENTTCILEEVDIKNPKPKNIIFVGQTGAGKSTLINSMANYVEYNFEDACKNEIKCYLPCQFQLQTPDLKNVIIKDGPENENENYNKAGQSVTQKPQTYFIKTKKHTFNIIDTPGLGDSRGAEQDLINVKHIRNAVHECGKIDGICFVIPSNISKLTANFEMVMRDLLSIFPKTALKNVAFFFTYANSTFFAIGESRNPIDEFIASFKATNNAEIPFGPENVYCVDSEAFMYFIATKHGHKYVHRTIESFEVSWTKSKDAINRFLLTLDKIEPIKSAEIQEVYDLEQIVIALRQEKNMDEDKVQLRNYVAEAAAQNSMSQFAAAFKNSTFKDTSKAGLKYALELFKSAIKTPELNQKISMFLSKYFSEVVVEDKNGIVKNGTSTNGTSMTGITDPTQITPTSSNCINESLKEIASILSTLWHNKMLDQSSQNALFDIFLAYFATEEVTANLKPALEHFLAYSKKQKDKDLEKKIKTVLFEIAKTTQ